MMRAFPATRAEPTKGSALLEYENMRLLAFPRQLVPDCKRLDRSGIVVIAGDCRSAKRNPQFDLFENTGLLGLSQNVTHLR